MPGAKLLAVAVVPPNGDHENDNGEVPPVALILMLPLLLPLQFTLESEMVFNVIAKGCVIVACSVSVQL